MQTKLKIIRVKDGSFTGDDGAKVEYYWVKGETEDGLTIEFGTKDSGHEEGVTKSVELEKTEAKGGKFRYKEILD